MKAKEIIWRKSGQFYIGEVVEGKNLCTFQILNKTSPLSSWHEVDMLIRGTRVYGMSHIETLDEAKQWCQKVLTQFINQIAQEKEG